MLDSPFWEEQREIVRRETAEQVRRETAIEMIRKLAEAGGATWTESIQERLLALKADELEQLLIPVARAPDAASLAEVLLPASRH